MKPLKTKAPAIQKNEEPPLNKAYAVIIVAYILITILVPGSSALDSSGPKFFALTILNLLVFAYFFFEKRGKKNDEPNGQSFFNLLGACYCMYIIFSLLSFVQSINVTESIFTLTRMLTVFAACYFIFLILQTNRRYLLYAALALTAVGIFDGLTVCYYFFTANSDFYELINIKTIYSNRNILAAAIFIKLPAAIWLFLFEKKWIKWFAASCCMLSVIAILILGTRSFYLGLLLLAIALAFYTIGNAIRERNRTNVKTVVFIFTGLAISVGILLSIQYFGGSDPAKQQWGLAQRLSSIDFTQASSSGRLDTWKSSLDLFAAHFFTGVGLGNWKIEILKIQSPLSDTFTYMTRTHNDFIEVLAETGIFGGLFFIAVILLPILIFVVLLFKKTGTGLMKELFIPALGLLCYSVDAFFNFPAERPEIQTLFATYLACAIAFFPFPKTGAFFQKFASLLNSFPLYRKAASLLAFAFLVFSVYVYALDVKHLQLLNIYKQEMKAEVLKKPARIFVDGFAWIPNISVETEPVAVITSRYLINEGKYQEALSLLVKDHSNPYDPRREYFMGMAYMKTGNADSAISCFYQVYRFKPRELQNLHVLCNLLSENGRGTEATGLLKVYLTTFPESKAVWLQLAGIHKKAGEFKIALATIDSSLKYFRNQTELIALKNQINREAKIKPYAGFYDRAAVSNQKGNFAEGLKFINEFLKHETTLAEAYEIRASSYFFLRDYKSSMHDIETALKLGLASGSLYNLRGMNWNELGNREAACNDFENSKKLGDKNGGINYQRLCIK